MAPVFAHGRLRLYLLKLLHEAPRHGYEVIRLLEERFQGLYAPSAGTVYPRLAKLEKEGLVSHSTEGGRKVYALTDAGRAELADRAEEIAGLEAEIRESVSSLAAEIREDVRGAAGDLRREVQAAARQGHGRGEPGEDGRSGDEHPPWEEVKHQWREQARRAREESRRAKEDARDARRQAKAAREDARDAMDTARDEMQRIARQVQEQVQWHAKGGDWQNGLREGLAELTRELGRFGQPPTAPTPPTPPTAPTASAPPTPPTPPDAPDAPDVPTPPTPPAPPRPPAGSDAHKAGPSGTGPSGTAADAGTGTDTDTDRYGTDPAEDGKAVADPRRELERLLDRFRDDIRDTARDRGVSEGQLREVRRHLSAAAALIAAALHRTTS